MYQVVVGNIGTILETSDEAEALRAYRLYTSRSLLGSGRAAYETVTILANDDIVREHTPSHPTAADVLAAVEYIGHVDWLAEDRRLVKGDITMSWYPQDDDRCVFTASRWDVSVSGDTPYEALLGLRRALDNRAQALLQAVKALS